MAVIVASVPLAAAMKTGTTMVALVGGLVPAPIGATVTLEMSVTTIGGSYTAAPLQGTLFAMELP
jgi:hypothetical protein